MCVFKGVVNRVAIMDSLASPFELFSPDCINSQIKQLALVPLDFDRIRYEEETIIELSEEDTKVIKEYIEVVKLADSFLGNPANFGLKEDENYVPRRKLLEKVVEALAQNPVAAVKYIEEYKEPEPSRRIFYEGYSKFFGILSKLRDAIMATKMYQLTKEIGDMREVFLRFARMRMAAFVETFVLEVPQEAVEIPGAQYSLPYGIKVKIYDLVGKEARFYTQTNELLQKLDERMKKVLRETISKNMEPIVDKLVDLNVLYQNKLLEYRRFYLDSAASMGISISSDEALAMAKETVNWTIGMGSPIENIAMDYENITDIYIDSENSPIYLEHVQYGLCHTPFRYNRKLLENAFLNCVLAAKIGKRLDDKNPMIDLMLTRLNMRCHLQGPPATFGELQCALRIMKPTPFTYSEYLYYKGLSAFYAGYDDVLVNLGCSEAVLGVKGSGKTTFTAAKIAAIGTKKRILPIQDIEEMPVQIYRKYGFHMGVAKVAPEEEERGALDLVKITSGLLRMGEAAIVVNELRSRTAIQGIINLLNTQPGVFCLYNFHAESLKDVQDRLELVFGIPAASMFATDRYTFLHKLRFGRKERLYRIVRDSYETDTINRRFVETFRFVRGSDINSSTIRCNFIENEEASKWMIDDLDMGEIKDKLVIKFIPPVLARRSEDTGIPPEQYILEAFMKGKAYSQITKASIEKSNIAIRKIEFVLKARAELSKIISKNEKESGEVDWEKVQSEWDAKFKELLSEYR
jgi:type IV secretory pathway ATPase VirB11/archaellum biosynthesis ATPase